MKVIHKAQLGDKNKQIEKRFAKLDKSMTQKKRFHDEDVEKKRLKEKEKQGIILEYNK